jgi:acylphosphatase
LAVSAGATLWYNPSFAAERRRRPFMDDPRIARTYYVTGIVQGVGYRHFVRRMAEALRVSGYARNLRDGRVEVYAMGLADQLEAFRNKIELGPPASAVTEVQEEPAQLLPRYGDEFAIEP